MPVRADRVRKTSKGELAEATPLLSFGGVDMKKLLHKIHVFFEEKRIWKEKMSEPLKIRIIEKE